MARLVTVVIPPHTVQMPVTFDVPARTLRVRVEDEALPDPTLPDPLVREPFADPDLAGRGWLETTPAWPFVTDDDLGPARLVLRLQFEPGRKQPVGTKWAARKALVEAVAEFTHVVKVRPVLLQTAPSQFSNHFLGTINNLDMAADGTPIPPDNPNYLAESSGRWYMDLHDSKWCGSLLAKRVEGCLWPKFYSPAGALRVGVWNQIVTHFRPNTVGAADGRYRTSVRYRNEGTWSSWEEIINRAVDDFVVAANANSKQSWVTLEGYSNGQFRADYRLADLEAYAGDQYEAFMLASASARGAE